MFIHFSSATILMRKRVFIKVKALRLLRTNSAKENFFINTKTEEKSLCALTLVTPHHKKLVNIEALAKGLFSNQKVTYI